MNNETDLKQTENRKEKKAYKTLERVTIDESLKEKLNGLVNSANESLKGMTEVNKSDILNLLLKLHSDHLSLQEVDELKKAHLDVFKCLTWLQNQAKDAKTKGADVSLKDLIAKSNELMGHIVDSRPKKIRKPRKSKNMEEQVSADPNDPE